MSLLLPLNIFRTLLWSFQCWPRKTKGWLGDCNLFIKCKWKKIKNKKPDTIDWVYSEAVVERCSMKKDVPRNFAKFTGKHLPQSLFFNKVTWLRPATLLKRHSGTGAFQWIFRNFWEYPFSQNTSGAGFCIFQHHTWKCFYISAIFTWTNRSDRLEVFCETGALKNYAKFTRKHQCQSVFLWQSFFY